MDLEYFIKELPRSLQKILTTKSRDLVESRDLVKSREFHRLRRLPHGKRI